MATRFLVAHGSPSARLHSALASAAPAAVAALVALALPAGCSSKSSGGPSTSDAEGFVGTWQRAGQETLSCPSSTPTIAPITGNLVITLGSSPETITGTLPSGCMETFTVAGAVATQMPGESCMMTIDGGMETQSASTHTLTLSADGQSLSEAASGTQTRQLPGQTLMCSYTANGTFTLQQ